MKRKNSSSRKRFSSDIWRSVHTFRKNNKKTYSLLQKHCKKPLTSKTRLEKFKLRLSLTHTHTQKKDTTMTRANTCKKIGSKHDVPNPRQKTKNRYDKLSVFQKNVILFLTEFKNYKKCSLHCEFKFRETEMKFHLSKLS